MPNSELISDFLKHLGNDFPKCSGIGVLVSCSGGPDSMVLLNLLCAVSDKLDIKPGVVHVNHNLRDDSYEEEVFVKSVADEKSVPFLCGRISGNEWNENRSDMERRARNLRYDIIAELAEKNGYSIVMTAHHRDDQLETLLMRIFDRGSGLRGICGILPERTVRGVSFIRPLLPFSKKELKSFLGDKTFIRDPSNENTEIRRNYFRKEIIPFLEERLSKNIGKHIVSLASAAQNEFSFSNELADMFWKNFLEEKSKKTDKIKYVIPRKEIKSHGKRFWMTAFSFLFSKHRGFSHCSTTLEDMALFIKKSEKAKCNYHPFVFSRNAESVVISTIETAESGIIDL